MAGLSKIDVRDCVIRHELEHNGIRCMNREQRAVFRLCIGHRNGEQRRQCLATIFDPSLLRLIVMGEPEHLLPLGHEHHRLGLRTQENVVKNAGCLKQCALRVRPAEIPYQVRGCQRSEGESDEMLREAQESQPAECFGG